MQYNCILIRVLAWFHENKRIVLLISARTMKELTFNLLSTAAALSSRHPSAGPSSHLLAPGQAQQLLFFDKDLVSHPLNIGNAPFLRSGLVSASSRARLLRSHGTQYTALAGVHLLSLLSGPRAFMNNIPCVRLMVLQCFHRVDTLEMAHGCA